jgi:uncharacterized protein YcsI (UPF0317 family)
MAPSRTVQVPATGLEARQRCRDNTWTTPTSGIATGYLQANLIVLPSRYAEDFRILCARNPVPCPLLASSMSPGSHNTFLSHMSGIPDKKIAADVDVRIDIPRYNVYIDGKLERQAITSLNDYWDSRDHVAFLIGCSYSFEFALADAGLSPTHMVHGRSVPMYRTNIPLCAAGIFTGSTYVVSMRLYRRSEVERVRSITRPYVTTHGEPIAWGWDGMRAIGIENINRIDWGEVPVDQNGREVAQTDLEADADGLVPVFWGCGVTPQEAVMNAGIPGVVMGHTPGHMLVLDVTEDDVFHSKTSD